MAKETITHFDPDPERLAPLRECMENYEVGDPDAEWPNNIISRKTVIYGSGVISRKGDEVQHNVAPDELALCKKLASDACILMDGIEVGMGSESIDYFQEFFIATRVGDPVPSQIDEALIWSKFGDTIFPLATITVEPFKEEGLWWSDILDDLRESDESEKAKYLEAWRALIKWFHEQPELIASAFIRIGDYSALMALDDLPVGTELVGSVLPRLALGLTRNGSLVGICGVSVQT